MPPVSERQRKAMYAAAEGKSVLGIPKAVGEEFIAKDATDGMAAGTVYVAPDGDILLLRRSKNETNYAGHWALPGGKAEEGETPEQTADREAREEMKIIPECAYPPKLIDSRVTPNKMAFHTFAQIVPNKFSPDLNEEHSGFAWVPLDQLPQPMHPAVMSTLSDRLGLADDMRPEDWDGLRNGFLKWLTEEEVEQEHAEDSIAMDRASVRSKDADGHLKVERTPITRAIVSPYLGREIPNWQTLGLEPERVYQIYRDADELAKAAPSFEGKPVLSDHIASRASNHPKDATVGAIGAPVEMVGDTLYAPLSIWDQNAIDDIESGEKRNLSCSYRYQYDPTPGTAPNGMPYDGRMVAIQANHVALVLEPRVPGSMVADSLPADLAVTVPNAGLPIGVSKRAPAHNQPMENEMASKAKDRARDEDPKASLMARLKDKLSDDEYKAACDEIESLMAGKANDESEEDEKKAKDEEEDKEKSKAADDEDMDAEDEKENDDKVSKEAMDSALKSAIADERKAQAAIREAERFVRPWVGDLAVAFDSAADVYRHAIEAQGRQVKDVHPSAYRSILEMLPKPGERKQAPRMAMDSANASGFSSRFPEASRIGVSLR